MWKEIIENPPGSQNAFAQSLTDNRLLSQAKFAGNCLRMSSFSRHQIIMNLSISYTLDTWSKHRFHTK